MRPRLLCRRLSSSLCGSVGHNAREAPFYWSDLWSAGPSTALEVRGKLPSSLPPSLPPPPPPPLSLTLFLCFSPPPSLSLTPSPLSP